MKKHLKLFRRAVLVILILMFFANNQALAVSYNEIINISAYVPVIGGGEGPSFSFPIDFIPPVISYLRVVKVDSFSAEIVWLTDEPATSQIEYGLDQSYGEASSEETSLVLAHSVIISGLIPDTLYHFRAVSEDEAANRGVSADHTFTTLPLPDKVPPANVSELKAVPGDGEIKLSWKNPLESDFAGVKIQRATNFYPLNPNEGTTIYTGTGIFFKDVGLLNGTRYYYSVFSYDFAGNFSSGAIVSAIPQKPEEFIPMPPLIPEKIPEIPGPPLRPQEKLKIDALSFFLPDYSLEFSLNQEKKLRTLKNCSIAVSIKKGAVPLTLKTILLVIRDEEEETPTKLGLSSYILKLNEDRNCYEAIIKIPSEEGVYPLTLSVLDYYTGILDSVEAKIISEPYGLVFKEQKNFQTEELEEIGIGDVRVALYELDDKSYRWKIWPGKKYYSQKNPYITGETGKFGFIVPEGKYRLEIQADGYKSVKTKTFKIEENIINPKIELTAPLRLNWFSFIIFIIFILIVGGIIRFRNIKTQNKNTSFLDVLSNKKNK